MLANICKSLKLDIFLKEEIEASDIKNTKLFNKLIHLNKENICGYNSLGYSESLVYFYKIDKQRN